MKSQSFTIAEAVRCTGYSRTAIEKAIHEGMLAIKEGRLSASDINSILKEKNKYISLREIALGNSQGKFDGNIAHDRERLCDFLEENDFFGFDTFDPESMVMGNSRDVVFFRREDADELNYRLTDFFCYYGLSERDKLEKLLNSVAEKYNTKKYILEYIRINGNEKILTPSFLSFTKVILSMPDVVKLTDADIEKALGMLDSQKAKDYMFDWLNYVKKTCWVPYNSFDKKKKVSVSITAYPMDTYLSLAKCLFNAEHIYTQKMIQKALDNYKFAEMWLYLSIYFVCGWRAGDACNKWRYLDLKNREEGCLGLDTRTLYDDILYDRIPSETYENVCIYCIKGIEISGRIASKNANSKSKPLRTVITSGLYEYFGLLILIAETHMLRSGKGFMVATRIPEYQNIVNLKAFFGPEIGEVLHDRNIYSRRMNKDFLQGIEDTGRKMGYGGILTSALASYARNHINLDTIRIYLKDHNLTGESADMVLFFMVERGVFGFEIYNTLITAYPEAMSQLSMKEQNSIIKQIQMSPLMIEQNQAGCLAAEKIKQYFLENNQNLVLEMMRSMYAITQEKGEFNEQGIYCLRGIHGQSCVHPNRSSCIVAACPYLVFTKYAYMPLLEILCDFKKRMEHGDKKSKAIYEKILMPRYGLIIKQFIKGCNLDMEERMGLKEIMREVLNG